MLTNTLSFLGKGVYHYKRDLPCQDYVVAQTSNNNDCNVTILSANDGCSASLHADIASKGIGDFTKEFIKTEANPFMFHPDSVKNQFLDGCNESIRDLAISNNLDLSVKNNFMSTTCTAFIYPDFTLCLHVGDGYIAALNKNLEIVYYSSPCNGTDRYHTRFTLQKEAFEDCKVSVLNNKDIEYILVSTDGLKNIFSKEGSEQLGIIQLLSKIDNGEIKCQKDLKNYIYSKVDITDDAFDDISIGIYSKTEIFDEQQKENEVTCLFQDISSYFNSQKNTDSIIENNSLIEQNTISSTTSNPVNEKKKKGRNKKGIFTIIISIFLCALLAIAFIKLLPNQVNNTHSKTSTTNFYTTETNKEGENNDPNMWIQTM